MQLAEESMVTIQLTQETNTHLFRMMMLDFTAILLGYNLPRDEARQVASAAVDVVRDHVMSTGTTLRRTRL